MRGRRRICFQRINIKLLNFMKIKIIMLLT
nr:MAG TPA: hypothetical protein [Caudoviricetes sp.]